MLGRRESWPAVAIMGVAMLALGVALKSGSHDIPMQPVWIMGLIGGCYFLLALALGGFTWRWPVVLAGLVAAHAALALLMGWGYSAVEGQGRAVYAALVHGLWDYVPGTALQVGFAGLAGVVLASWLWPLRAAAETIPGETIETVTPPDLQAAPDTLTAALAVAQVPGVAGVLWHAGNGAVGAGVWTADPGGAGQRLRALVHRSGNGLNSLSLGPSGLLLRAEGERFAALLVSSALSRESAHDLLRVFWAAESRLADQDLAEAATP